MNALEKKGTKQKKSMKCSSNSRRATSATAATSARSGALVGGPGVVPAGSGVPVGGPDSGTGAPTAGTGVGGRTAPHPSGVFWPVTSNGSSFMGDLSPSSSEWLYPPGGFVNSLQMPQTSPPFARPYPYANFPDASNLPENFHFVGGPSTRGTPSPKDAADTQEKETIDIDDDETPEPTRTEKRLNWSHEEDVRLVSAWLQNSLDPVDGNDKKSDQYWADVIATYNSDTPSNRWRNRNQLKIRWDRVKKPVSEFHGCWVRTTRVFQSGVSDDQRTDQALQMYASEHGDKPFLLQHIWRVVRHERKWAAYVKKMNKETQNNAANVVNVENSPKKRPIGHKRAKYERNGKPKTPEAISAISDKLDKFINASTKAEKVAERQEILVNKKLEVAKEQTKIKMIDLYKDLLCGSISGLSEDALAERSKALDCIRSALFAKDG